MPDDQPDTAEALMDKTVVELARYVSNDVDQPGAVCTNWILVAEWSTPDGQHFVSRFYDSDRPMWQHQGLLHHALHGNWGRK